MHAAWNVSEVRVIILDHLSSGDVARLARTCKDIHDYVIDHLWQDVKTFDGFTQLLPPYPRTEPLTVNDLERLDLYGRKVRRLDLTTGNGEPKLDVPPALRVTRERVDHHKILASVEPWIRLWEEIAWLRPQTAFLPNLQYLLVNNAAAELVRPLIGISGARLRSIFIKFAHEPKDLLRKMLGSFQETPKLEHLYVRNGLYHIPEVLIHNSPLVTLKLDENAASVHRRPPLPVPRALLMKSTLQYLTVSLHEFWYDPESWPSNEKILPALRQLRLSLRAVSKSKCHPDCPDCAMLLRGNDVHRPTVANSYFLPRSGSRCKRRPPSVFVRSLDHPRLELLNIKFGPDVDGALFIDTMRAVVETCPLDNLVELVLTNGGFGVSQPRTPIRGSPLVHRDDVREMLKIFGPLPRLRVLHLPLACDFLLVLDMKDYKRVAEALPALQTLTLGHRDFVTGGYGPTEFHQLTPLKHVAAFCHLFPALSDVEIGYINATAADGNHNPEWTCHKVRRLYVHLWLRPHNQTLKRQQQECQTYFPNADLCDENSHPYQKLWAN